MIFYRRWRRPQILSFDLDDTLYDNRPVLLHAEQQLRQHLSEREPRLNDWQLADWASHRQAVARQHPQLAHDMTALRGESIKQALLSLGHPEPLAQAWQQQAVELFLTHRNQIQLAPRVLQLMQRLAERYPLVAITNGNADPSQFGLDGLFTSCHRPENGLRMKPHSDLFALAQQQHRQHGESWLHIGDHTRSDVAGALSMGWQACWLNNRPHRKPLLQLPHVEIAAIEELQSLLL